ncbi:hypothetical protein KIH74_14890 [Kineosporia sp. J2-2]|uniref:Branched-chain amino acid ATP-binding cassette transporter C-terminal domain-containing protein n=1 Tax=Kineosporia corallincola TaxID=2835133 RepID=A0ABS5TGK9_9ACTN|nr:hypothetical protein [Kineosporia corallincola]
MEQTAWLTFEATQTCPVMENGVVARSGPPARLRHDERVRKVYLGLRPGGPAR